MLAAEWPVVASIINALVVIASAMLGLLVRNLTARIEELRTTDTAMRADMNEMKVLLAGQYPRRQEFDDLARELRALQHTVAQIRTAH